MVTSKKTLIVMLLGGSLLALTALIRVEDAQIEPLPAPPSLDAKKVALGKMLFFDTRLSGDGSMSCATCHNPGASYMDSLELSVGYPTSLYFRNTPTILNTAFKKTLYWDGRIAGTDLPTLVRDHISEAHFFRSDGRWCIERLRQVPEYERRFKEAFGGEPSYGKILNAVAAFVRSQNSTGAPVDAFLKGNSGALSASAKKGYELFTGKAGCVSCHNGPLLSDNNYHNTGVPVNPDIFAEPTRHITFRRFFKTLGVDNYANLREDLGRYAITKKDEDKGKFRTAPLREVAKTPPYMHNGMLKTLEDVVEFYNKGGGNHTNKDPLLKPLNLTDGEKQDLVEFLKALSGKDVNVKPPILPEYEVREFGNW